MSGRLSNRELAYIVTFGTLWGVSEITLGLALHNIHVPFTGLIQTAIGTLIALTAMNLTGRKRTLIYSSVIAAILKIMSFTTIKIFPFIGILMSAAVGQAVIFALGINLVGMMAAGGAMCCWPFAQSLLFYLLAYSPKFLEIYQHFLQRIGLGSISISSVIAVIFLAHFIFGVSAGFISWRISVHLKTRLKRKDN